MHNSEKIVRQDPVSQPWLETGMQSAPNPDSATKAVNIAQRSAQVQHLTQLQAIANGVAAAPIQRKSNDTGLPDQLRSGIESLSGVSMEGVKVHYNSAKPATLQAHAYAQGRDIHIAPGQERHLPHEAWHVVQQAQGRVRPTLQMKGVAINDDSALEREADVMGARSMGHGHGLQQVHQMHGLSLGALEAGTTAIAQLANAGDLTTWAQANAATAVFEDLGYTNDFVTLRIQGQTVGANNNCTIIFHIHIPENGRIANCFSGSMFEDGKRGEGEIQSQEVVALNTIRNRWKQSKLDEKEEIGRTPVYLAAQIRAQEEAAAKQEMEAMGSAGSALAAVSAAAEVTDEEFVTELLKALNLPIIKGLVGIDVKDLKSGKKTREDVRAYWMEHAARKLKEANSKSGSWRS